MSNGYGMFPQEENNDPLGEARRERDELRKRIAELEAQLKDMQDRLNNGIKYDEELNVYVVVWTERELEQVRIEADKIMAKLESAKLPRSE